MGPEKLMMNRRTTLPFVISILFAAGVASASWTVAVESPQGDAPAPKPSASVPPKEKPAPKPEQPKKPPPSEGGW